MSRIMKGTEGGRAKFAFDCAQNNKEVKDYSNYVKKIPMMIKVNGLAAALAFMKEKGKAYKIIGKNIAEWLIIKNLIKSNSNDPFISLIEQSINMNSREYRLVTNEVFAFLNWLRRFASGLKDDNKNG